MKIEDYRIPLTGTYNKSIFVCPHCDKNIQGTLFTHVIGWAQSNYGQMMVVECPKCFEKYYFHLDETYEFHFLDHIERGLNIHLSRKEG